MSLSLPAPGGLVALCLMACAMPDDSAVPCTEAELAVTWENWGAGFFAGYCRTCHSSTTTNRRGAPVGVDFDSVGLVRDYADAIRVTTLELQEMPVGGGVQEDELILLDRFLRCGL